MGRIAASTLWKAFRLPTSSVTCRAFSSDPYKTLGLNRNASAEDIKKAYREKAHSTHPDKHPNQPEDARDRFAEVGNAYEILKDPEKKREYDHTGRVGGTGGFGGAGHGSQGGQEEMEQMLEFMRRRQQAMQQQRPPPLIFPQADMEAKIRSDVARIHLASRASSIDEENDTRRAAYAGRLGTVADVDSSDQSVKVRIMVSPGRADQVWFGADALWDPRVMAEGLEVQVPNDVEAIHRASRAAGIDMENDDRRTQCSGKRGTVLRVDTADQSAKVRVFLTPRRVDELWFGIDGIEPAS